MAFAATTEFDVRTTGSDSNGGGFNTSATGTDRSQSDTPFVTYTDLVIGGTNTTITSVAFPFGATSPGNIINITGGTGFTVQRVQIVSVAGAVATCDKAVGTASSTGGTGNLGGALATIGAANALLVAGNIVHIKSGTYTLTAAIAVPVATATFRGFGTTHGDRGTRPLITCATNSVNLFTTSSNGGMQTWDNLSMSHTAGTRGSGILQLTAHGTTQYWVVINCALDGFSNGINSDNVGSDFDLSNIFVVGSEIKNCTATGIFSNVGSLLVSGCWIHDNALFGINTGNVILSLERSIVSNNHDGVSMTGSTTIAASVANSTIANNTVNGLWPSANSIYVMLRNVISYGHAAGGDIRFNIAFGNLGRSLAMSCNNATGSTTNWGTSQGDVTLTAGPFTSSTDFGLNSTAGGGAACKGAGYPGVFPGALSTGYLDIGAVQSRSGASQSQMFIVT